MAGETLQSLEPWTIFPSSPLTLAPHLYLKLNPAELPVFCWNMAASPTSVPLHTSLPSSPLTALTPMYPKAQLLLEVFPAVALPCCLSYLGLPQYCAHYSVPALTPSYGFVSTSSPLDWKCLREGPESHLFQHIRCSINIGWGKEWI